MAYENYDIRTALVKTNNKLESYTLYKDYYDGEHKLTFATAKFRNAFGNLFQAFSDNLMPAVVDALADRLQIEGFQVEEGDEQAGEIVAEIWKKNRMDRRAGEAHLEALTMGDSYVIVWPDADGNPTIYPQKAGYMTVEYDPENPGNILWASKLWQLSDKTLRLNLYFPDRIEKYKTLRSMTSLPTKEDSFVQYIADGEEWPLPNPYGKVPVFHFANNASVGDFGKSELKDVIPLQNALNKTITDMLVAQEFVALPQRWATGLEVEIDETTGKPRTTPFIPGVDRIWAVGDKDVTFGEFSPASLEQFLAVQESFRTEIARISGTPFHYMSLTTGDFPSGEALKTSEQRFLSKVKDRMSAFGNAWEDVMTFACKIAGVEDASFSTQWKDPAPKSELEHMNALALKAEKLGIPQEQLWKEAGYTDEEIKVMKDGEAEKEAQSSQSRVAQIRAEQAAILGKDDVTNAVQ